MSLPFPALLTVVKEISFPRLPTLCGKQRARKLDIPLLGPGDINLKEESVGLSGSPTRVVKVFRPKVARNGEQHVIKDEADVEKVADKLIGFLQERQLV